MLYYCLKCRKNAENIQARVSKTSKGKKMIYQNVLYVAVKNQNLLRNKKQKGY